MDSFSSPRCLALASAGGVYMHTKSMKMCSCVVVMPKVDGSTVPSTVWTSPEISDVATASSSGWVSRSPRKTVHGTAIAFKTMTA